MTQRTKTPATAKKYQLFVGTELKLESNKPEDTLKELHKLQKENVAEIKLVNHVVKLSHLYSKGRYDKNYRITGTEYLPYSKDVAETN